jgi:hypothetical protein
VVLALTGVPFAAAIALLVAIADLIPLVGATLGAIIAGGAGFLHSPTAGVVVLVFFVVYQQVENHLLQPVIMSHAVQLNPLTVLVSVLIAAELGGLVGACWPSRGRHREFCCGVVPAVREAGPWRLRPSLEIARGDPHRLSGLGQGGPDQPAGDHPGDNATAYGRHPVTGTSHRPANDQADR